MHEKIKNLSELVDKLIELNFKVKTENKSLQGKITELEQKISNLVKENQLLVMDSKDKNE
jgi:regulator of replication initiation timing